MLPIFNRAVPFVAVILGVVRVVVPVVRTTG